MIDSTYNNESIINDTIYKAGINNTTIIEEIAPTTQKINEEKNTKIENNNIDTTQYIEKQEKPQTTIITEKVEIKIIPTTIVNIPTTNVKLDIKKQNINGNEVENGNHYNNNTKITNQHNEKSGFIESFKSFLKNKLIYFLLAFLGIILGFVSIIIISCAIISCVKYCKRQRRDYMEQVDVEVPRYSKDNNMSSYSY